MLTPCSNTCLGIAWNMFTQYLKTYFHHVERLLTRCWKTWKYRVKRCIHKMFDIFQSYLKTCLQFLRLSNVMFWMNTCLHKMSSIFTQMCLYNVWTILTKINDICYQIFEAIFIQICPKCWKYFKCYKNLTHADRGEGGRSYKCINKGDFIYFQWEISINRWETMEISENACPPRNIEFW